MSETTQADKRPRGIRNNNPGNIEDNGTAWLGLVPADQKGAEERFCVFQEPVYGIRAMARILLTYQSKHNLMTLRAMISRWAPPSENDTEAYIAHVADACGRSADEAIDLSTDKLRFESLVATIIRHENGIQPYNWQDITCGCQMAGAGS